MTNLITNGDAETGDLTGWASNGPYPLPVVVAYDSVDASGLAFPRRTDSEQPDPGTYFFAGGDGVPLASMGQTIDLAPLADLIATGVATWTFSAYAGGWGEQDDYAGLTVEFVGETPDPDDAEPHFLARLLPVQFSADRKGATGLKAVSLSGTVPTWATQVLIGVQCFRVGGRYNDGYVDGLELTIE